MAHTLEHCASISMCACRKTSFGTPMSVYHSVFCGGRTQWVVLSAPTTQNCVKNARGGPKRRLQQAPTAVGGTPAA